VAINVKEISTSNFTMKNIYFAGSIRGGRADAELYKRIIKYIQREHIVLTEHVGDLSLSKTEGLKDRDTEMLPFMSRIQHGSRGRTL
jgi:hypothetical protein